MTSVGFLAPNTVQGNSVIIAQCRTMTSACFLAPKTTWNTVIILRCTCLKGDLTQPAPYKIPVYGYSCLLLQISTQRVHLCSYCCFSVTFFDCLMPKKWEHAILYTKLPWWKLVSLMSACLEGFLEDRFTVFLSRQSPPVQWLFFLM